MKTLVCIVFILILSLCVWGSTPTPEKIAEWKEDAKNGDDVGGSGGAPGGGGGVSER